MRYFARKMERDPGAGGGPHEKVSLSNVETRVSHSCNQADLPCARSVSATRKNQGTPRLTQLIMSMQIEYLSVEGVREPAWPLDSEIPGRARLLGQFPIDPAKRRSEPRSIADSPVGVRHGAYRFSVPFATFLVLPPPPNLKPNSAGHRHAKHSLDAELTEMMIQVFVHQDSPFRRS